MILIEFQSVIISISIARHSSDPLLSLYWKRTIWRERCDRQWRAATIFEQIVFKQNQPPFCSPGSKHKPNSAYVPLQFTNFQHNFSSLEDALAAVRRGDMWGVLHLSEKFSVNLQKRFAFLLYLKLFFLLIKMSLQSGNGRRRRQCDDRSKHH